MKFLRYPLADGKRLLDIENNNYDILLRIVYRRSLRRPYLWIGRVS